MSSLGTRHSEPVRTLRMSNPFNVSAERLLVDYGFHRGETESPVNDAPAFLVLPSPPAPIAGEQRAREGRALSPVAVSVCLARFFNPVGRLSQPYWKARGMEAGRRVFVFFNTNPARSEGS